MKNAERVAQMFEKQAERLRQLRPTAGVHLGQVINAQMGLDERARQVRQGQIVFDHAEALIEEIGQDGSG